MAAGNGEKSSWSFLIKVKATDERLGFDLGEIKIFPPSRGAPRKNRSSLKLNSANPIPQRAN
jgi:hypothetical protein